MIAPVVSVSTIWRIPRSLDANALGGCNRAVAAYRDRYWQQLENSPSSFPWLMVSPRVLTDTRLIDTNATVVFTTSEKDNAEPTYEGGVGSTQITISADNTDAVLGGNFARATRPRTTPRHLHGPAQGDVDRPPARLSSADGILERGWVQEFSAG